MFLIRFTCSLLKIHWSKSQSKKNTGTMNILMIKTIYRGAVTPVFQKHLAKSKPTVEMESCFSIYSE